MSLTVDWGQVERTADFPVTGGIPLAKGALKDPRAVRLSAGGRELALQSEVLAWWPDKSVKWLLLDFQASPAQKDFSLEYGPGVKASAQAKGIVASAEAGSVSVDTGAIKFAVRSDGAGFIDELSFGGAKIFDSAGKRLNFMDAIHTASPADYHPMNRYVKGGQADPSRLELKSVTLEQAGPLHAVVLIDGAYKFELVGSTITGTDIKGDCPFRVRIHAYAGQSFLKVEHFFYYEGDGDHDFVKSLALKVPLPAGEAKVRCLDGDRVMSAKGPLSGLYQESADSYELWNSDGRSVSVVDRGRRFEGVLDVATDQVSVAVSVKDFWQNAAKSLRADLTEREVGIYLWPSEACPLDFRRHAREWSVGESGAPRDPQGDTPAPIELDDRPNYRLASKGVGKTHYAAIHFHDGAADGELLDVAALFNHRPLLWAPAGHYAASGAMGRYRQCVPGEHDDVEEALDMAPAFWRLSQDRFNWYGFWLYGNVNQEYNNYQQVGRWTRDFGRWGWANGDSVGRLAYALMLHAVRKCRREDLEFAEKYLYNVHDVCSTHSDAYPHHFLDKYIYVKGGCHRHGAWPWAGPYVGARGAHPVGTKIYYFLTGEGHAGDILEEMTQLALKNPHGGEGDGPIGINAQTFLYQWEATGDDQWRRRLKAELDNSKRMREGTTAWSVMMTAAFGIANALEEYVDLTGDTSCRDVVAAFADRTLPERMKDNWTWGGYYRVHSFAYNITRDAKYLDAMKVMLPVYVSKMQASVAAKIDRKDWPGPAGGARSLVDGNIIRDIPFVLYALHQGEQAEEERPQ